MTPDEQNAVANMTDEQFRHHISEILARELGTGGYARFLRTYSSESGVYTRDRREWLGEATVESIITGIRQHRQKTA